jgi:protein gp37
MAETSIEWTDATWNPVAGCTVLTAGCTNCYAMRMAARLDAMGQPKYKPRKVFVNSMSDLFHTDVPPDFIARVWATMKATPRHTYQILTKRPDRMAEVLSRPEFEILPNVWLGTSVEDEHVLSRLDDIRKVPAAIRFVSLEPLIGSVAAGELTNIDWAIVGGESGPRARPMDPEWVSEIKTMCRRSGTAFFFKQWGGKNKKAAGRLLRGRTYDELPALSM